MTRYLLDTNATIDLLNKRGGVQQILKADDELYIPATSLGELYFGAENSARVSENIKRVEKFAANYTIVDTSHETAKIYGRLRLEMRRKGRLPSQNDMWIASLALQFNLMLLTRDRDFDAISGLTVVSW